MRELGTILGRKPNEAAVENTAGSSPDVREDMQTVKQCFAS